MNTIGDPAVASKAMAVGAYITKETWQRNYGSDANFADNLHPFSSRGPGEDGGVQAEHRRAGRGDLHDAASGSRRPVGGTYTLPPGYAMLQRHLDGLAAGRRRRGAADQRREGQHGCSEAARPAPAGADRRPRGSSPRYGAYEQGNGLIDVGAAWSLLKTQHQDRRHHVVGPGAHAAQRLPRDAGTRRGHLRPRGRHRWATSYTRTYTFTRNSGRGRHDTTYNLAWVGNDGTFSSRARAR